MTKARKGPAKVKGAVLIMILAVMTVLIILLAGSIAVVYSTHQRVTVKYQESQAYYTMRSTLDVCLDNIINSEENALSSQEVWYYEGGTPPFKVLKGSIPDDKLKRGRYEELVLYQVPVSTETSDPDDPDYNKWYKTRRDEGVITDEAQVNLEANDFNGTGFSGTEFNNFKAQYTAAKWTSSMERGVDDTITYRIDYSSIANMAVNDSGETLTKMLDNTGDDSVLVKFQVLERLYDLGGSTSDPYGKRFALGDRAKDYFRVKATCEINIDGEPQTYSVFYSTKEPDPQMEGTNSLSKLTPGSKIRFINQANSLENVEYHFTNNSVTTNDVNLFGDFKNSAGGCEFALSSEDTMFIKGTYDAQNQPSPIVVTQTGGTVYFENLINNQQPLVKTHETARANVICSGTYTTICKDNSQNISLYANNFKYDNSNPSDNVMLFQGTSFYNNVLIRVNNANDLNNNYATINNTAKTITINKRFRNLVGSCYISNSIVFYDGANTKVYQIDSNTPPAAGMYTLVNGPVNPPGDIYDTATVVCDRSKIVNANYNTAPMTSDYKKSISLPTASVGGSTTVALETPRSIFGERFLDVGTDGNPTWNAVDGTLATTFPISQDFLTKHLQPRETAPSGTDKSSAGGSGVPGISGGTLSIPKDPSNKTDTVNLTFNSIITKDNGVLKLKGHYGGDTCFDTTAGDITVVFDDYVKGRFYVAGTNKLKIYLTSPDGTFDLGGSDHQFMLVDFNTINASTNDVNTVSGKARGSKTEIYVCDKADGTPTVTSMTMYKLDSTGVNGVGPVVCAQINAPKTNFSFNSSGGMNYHIQIPGDATLYTMQLVPVAVMGSVFAYSYTSGEDRAIWSMLPQNEPGDKVVHLIERYR